MVKKLVCYFRHWLVPMVKYPSRIPGQLAMEQCYYTTTEHTNKEHRAFVIAVIGKSFSISSYWAFRKPAAVEAMFVNATGVTFL